MAKKTASPKETTPIADEIGDRLTLLKSRLRVAKTFSKKPHKAWKKWVAEYNIEDVDDTGEIRDKVRIGYVFRKTESEIPAIFDDQPDIFIKGKNTRTKEIAPLIEGVYDFLWDTQHLEEVIEDAGLYFELIGMAFVESPWVTKTKKVQEMQAQPITDPMTGQPVIDPMTGQPATQEVPVEYDVPVIDNPMATAANPWKLHFSPETKFNPVMDYEHCPYYFKEHTMTVEEVKSRFGKTVGANDKLKVQEFNIDDETELDQDKGVLKDDLKRVSVYEYYGCLPERHKPEEANKPWTYDADYHIFFTNNEELKVEDCPYDTKPLIPVGNYGMANTFWKFGDAKHLMPLVQELQAYRSQILRHTRKMANPKILVPESSSADEEALRNPLEGVLVKYSGAEPPSYLSPANLGAEVGVGVDMVRTDLEKTSGTFDIGSGGSQSQVKSPRGIAVYSEASDKSVRRKRKKIARLIRQLMIFQFGQVAQNWNPQDNHVITIVDGGDSEDLQVTAEVLQILGDPQVVSQIDIEAESLSLNRVQMRQEALDLFDLASRNPQTFNVYEVAKDLMQNGFNKRDGDRFLVPQGEAALQMLQGLIMQNPEAATQMVGAIQKQQLEQGLAADQQNAKTTEQFVNQPQQGDLPPLQ